MSSEQLDHSPKVFVVVALIVVAPWLWMFGPLIASDEVFAFRDAGNLYYPLFEWQCAEWGAGRIPLWNPYDNLGNATFADATSSVLYPGKLVFALPCRFALRFNLYIALHVLLAAWSTYFLARRWDCSPAASGLAAISYAYGGYVLFQYSNVVYLVGAAWLPLAIWFADAMLANRSTRHAMGLGVILALMTLGGDPQTAYHVGMLAALYALILWRHDSKKTDSPPLPDSRGIQRWCRSRPVLLAVAAGISFGLAAIQVLPTWEWAQRSHRAYYERPRNVYEAVGALLQSSDSMNGAKSWPMVRAGLFGKPPANSHAAHVYYYSLGPWRLAEMFWPNVSGKMFPIHRRWLTSLPAEGRTWIPSLYGGVIPLIAAICAWRWRRGACQDRWAIMMVLIGIFSSFGWYGMGWVLEEIQTSVAMKPPEPQIGQPVGGLYWLFTVLLPGYDYFRYPAKWFVVAALGLSLLSARGIDRLAASQQTARRVSICLATGSLIFVLLALVLRPVFLNWASEGRGSELFGPLDAQGSWRDLISAFSHTSIAALCFLFALRPNAFQRVAKPAIWILMITALDVTLSNRWLLGTTRASVLEDASTAAASYGLHSTFPKPPPRILHDRRQDWTPRSWRESSDPDRLSVICARERQTLFYKHHLTERIAALDTRSTLFPAEFQALLNILGQRAEPARALDRDRLLGTLGVECVLAPQGSTNRLIIPTTGFEPPNGDDLMFFKPQSPIFPRAWIVRDVRSHLLQHRETTIEELEKHLRQMWFTQDLEKRHDARGTVFVEPAQLKPELEQIEIEANETCVVNRYEPQHIEIDVELNAPGLLVLSDLYDRGWKASVRTNNQTPTQSQSIVCVNGLIRGVWLPAGSHNVTMYYRPTSFVVGAIGTILTAVLVVGGLTRWRTTSPSGRGRE